MSVDSPRRPTELPRTSGLTPRKRRVSRVAGVFCFMLAPVLLIATIYASLQIPHDQLAARLGVNFAPHVSATKAYLVTALAWIPVSLASVALVNLGRCFRAISLGEHFSSRTIAGLQRFAGMMAASSLMGVVVPTVCSVLLTYDQGPGRGQLGLHVSSHQLFGLLCAVGTWLCASLLMEAQSLKQENEEFV